MRGSAEPGPPRRLAAAMMIAPDEGDGVTDQAPEATNQIYGRLELQQLSRSFVGGRAILDRAVALIPDVLEDPEYSRDFALAGG